MKTLYPKPYTLNPLQGFTLIEVLTVVAIIGLLASVVLVGLGSFRTRGRDTRRIADLRSTQNALELYYTKFGEYPADGSWDDVENALKNAGVGVTKIARDPLVKPTQDQYAYDISNDRQSYVLRAQLEDVANPALNDDFDSFSGASSIPGITLTCTDTAAKPYYCIQF